MKNVQKTFSERSEQRESLNLAIIVFQQRYQEKDKTLLLFHYSRHYGETNGALEILKKMGF